MIQKGTHVYECSPVGSTVVQKVEEGVLDWNIRELKNGNQQVGGKSETTIVKRRSIA